MFWSLVGLFFLGLVVGFLARLLVRSPARLGCIGTAILGIVGSYAGGSLGSILFHDKFDLRKAGTFLGRAGRHGDRPGALAAGRRLAGPDLGSPLIRSGQD